MDIRDGNKKPSCQHFVTVFLGIYRKTKNSENRVLAISHCNCPERARAVKEKLEKLAKFKKIIITDTAGVSTMYANDGGVIIAV